MILSQDNSTSGRLEQQSYKSVNSTVGEQQSSKMAEFCHQKSATCDIIKM